MTRFSVTRLAIYSYMVNSLYSFDDHLSQPTGGPMIRPVLVFFLMGGNMFPILVTLGTLEILGMCVVWLSLLMIISIIVLVLFFFIITVLIITLRLSKPLQSNNLRESNGKLRKTTTRERERTPYITYYNLVGGFKHFFLFSIIYGIILSID